MEYMESLLLYIANAATLIFEFTGILVLIISGVKGFWCYLKKDPGTRLNLAKGMAMGLEFKLGSEILRTVVVRGWKELGIVAGIIVVRAALTFLIHWEILQEEQVEK